MQNNQKYTNLVLNQPLIENRAYTIKMPGKPKVWIYVNGLFLDYTYYLNRFNLNKPFPGILNERTV